MIYCCGCYYNENHGEPNREINLLDNVEYRNRIMEIGTCPKCGTRKALIRQYRTSDGRYIEKKPKNTKPATVNKFIKHYEQEPFLEFEHKAPRHGSKTNMSWYWVDGSRDLWTRDFNDTKQFMVSAIYEIVS